MRQPKHLQRLLPQPNKQDEIVVVARIRGAFGVRGWVHIQSYTEPPENLLSYPLHWQVDGLWHPIKANLKKHKEGFVAQFSNIEQREEAQLLNGRLLGANPADFSHVKDDEVLWQDLVGLRVANTKGFDFGVVKALTETGHHDVLVIKSKDGDETLIPFADEYIEELSIEKGLLVVDWDEDW